MTERWRYQTSHPLRVDCGFDSRWLCFRFFVKFPVMIFWYPVVFLKHASNACNYMFNKTNIKNKQQRNRICYELYVYNCSVNRMPFNKKSCLIWQDTLQIIAKDFYCNAYHVIVYIAASRSNEINTV